VHWIYLLRYAGYFWVLLDTVKFCFVKEVNFSPAAEEGLFYEVVK
jgi:hypothetical protein